MDLSEIARICDRHHGIGADGVMIFQGLAGDLVQLDHLDPDGARSLCLNGVRATLACLHSQGKIRTLGRVRCEGVTAQFKISEKVHLGIPLPEDGWRGWMGANLRKCYEDCWIEGHYVDVGNPHVIITQEMELAAFRRLAPKVRADGDFPRGANVHWVRLQDDVWNIYSYERGVEGFTLACGSGMLAAAAVLLRQGDHNQITFCPEGEGEVTLAYRDRMIWMSGPTRWVVKGEWLCGC